MAIPGLGALAAIGPKLAGAWGGASNLVKGSLLTGGSNILAGGLQGGMSKSAESEASKEQAESIRRKRDILNNWGLPVGQLGVIQGGYSQLSGRSANPQSERLRQQGIATGTGLMQSKVSAGQPGYQQAVQEATQQSARQQKQITPGDMMGMMWALYFGQKALSGARG